MNSVACFQKSVVYEQILQMQKNCDFGRALMVCGGWFDLALKYWIVADGLEKSDVVRELSFLTIDRDYEYENLMLDDMSLL